MCANIKFTKNPGWLLWFYLIGTFSYLDSSKAFKASSSASDGVVASSIASACLRRFIKSNGSIGKPWSIWSSESKVL